MSDIKLTVKHISKVNTSQPKGDTYAYIILNEDGDLELFIENSKITKEEIAYVLNSLAEELA